MSSKARKKTYSNQPQDIEFCGGNYALIPIILVIFLVTLIMRVYLFDSGLGQFAWFPDKTTSEVDVFLFWKGIVLISIAVIMTIILAFRIYKDHPNIKKDYWLIPLTGYGLLALVSTLFSQYRNYGFTGIYEQFESIWVILAYCIVAFYTFYHIKTDNDLRVVRKAFFYLLVVLVFIGFTQLIGKDFFESDLGRRIFVPEQYASLRDELTFTFSGSGNHQVYLTLYNPNYVGMFAALALPITLVLAFVADNWVKKATWGILTLLMFICTLGSGSKSFIISLAVSALIGVIFFRKLLLKHIRLFLLGATIFIGCAVIYLSVTNVNLVNYVKNALVMSKNEHALEDIILHEDNVEVVFLGNRLHIQYFDMGDGIYFFFYDESNNMIEYYIKEDGKIALSDERFSRLDFAVYGGNEQFSYIIGTSFENKFFSFAADSSGYHFINSSGKEDELYVAEDAIFGDYDSFASGRGYIWSRTIPLLKKYFVLGSGADTFSIAFPQSDYVGKINAGYGSMIITKPHCMYLQIGVQSGVLSLICFLAVCAIYLLQSFKLYWKSDFSSPHQIFGLGIMLGVIGYLISAIANDSTVALAPLFWVFLGVGYAVNKITKKQTQESKEI